MNSILLTGGAGFIGSRLTELILSTDFPQLKDSRVVVIDALRYSGRRENLSHLMDLDRLTFIEGDISDSDLVRHLYEEFSIDTTINVAAESHVDNSIKDPVLFIKTNTLGTAVLLNAHRAFGAKRFLQVSTDEVYGSINEGAWSEDFPLSPRSPYSASKASADLLTLSFAKTYSMDVVITRCCNNYGPRQFPEKVIPLFITNLIQGRKIPIYGSGENRREWIHVDDHCRGIIRTLLFGTSQQVHHIGSRTEYSNNELAQLICDHMGKKFDEVSKYVEDRKGHDFRYALDDSLTRETISFKPEIEFQNGLQETINWYLQNQDWWKSLVKK